MTTCNLSGNSVELAFKHEKLHGLTYCDVPKSDSMGQILTCNTIVPTADTAKASPMIRSPSEQAKARKRKKKKNQSCD